MTFLGGGKNKCMNSHMLHFICVSDLDLNRLRRNLLVTGYEHMNCGESSSCPAYLTTVKMRHQAAEDDACFFIHDKEVWKCRTPKLSTAPVSAGRVHKACIPMWSAACPRTFLKCTDRAWEYAIRYAISYEKTTPSHT